MIRLNPVWALAICLEITSTSGPFGEIYCISSAYGWINQIKIMLPLILNIQCARAVRLASLLCPRLASNAVIVVPILSPNRIGIAPARPRILAPFGPACSAKFCKTAMVAELLCTTSVINVPTQTPRIGISATFAIIAVKTGLPASGFITSPIVSIPKKRTPNAKTVCPMFFTFSDLHKKETINPAKIST